MSGKNQGQDLLSREIPLNGKCITADDPIVIGATNFKRQVNLRCGNKNPRPILGQTPINTTGLSNRKIRSGIHYTGGFKQESHIIVQAFDANGANSGLYKLSNVVPAQGDFDASVFFSETNAANQLGVFSEAPGGMMAYCNGTDAILWPGNEMLCAGWIDYDPAGSYRYDFTRAMQNDLQDAVNLASIHTVPGGLDSSVVTLLHGDATPFVDSSPASVHTVTNGGAVVLDTVNKTFGAGAMQFPGTAGSYLQLSYVGPDDDYDFSGGTWTIDCRKTAGTWEDSKVLWHHETDANNFFQIKTVLTGGVPGFKLYSKNATVVELNDTFLIAGLDSGSHHIAFVESGDSYYIFVDGELRGFLSSAFRLLAYTGTPRIGADSADANRINLTLEEFRVSKASARWTSAFQVPVTAYGTSAQTNILLLSTLPLRGYKIYVKTANASAATLQTYEWNGSAFSAVASQVDGTSVGGKAIAQTGSVSFTSTAATAKVKAVDENLGFWYLIQMEGCDTATRIYQVTLDAAPQQIRDTWDGTYRGEASFQNYKAGVYQDFTTNVFDDSWDAAVASTYAQIGGLVAATEFDVIGFVGQQMGLKIGIIGGYANAVAGTFLRILYWNGTAWVDVGKIDDGTANGNISFAKSGTITWNPPTLAQEFTTTIAQGSGAAKPGLHYYKLQFSKNLSADVRVYYAAGIPAPNVFQSYDFPFFHLNRLWLCKGNEAWPSNQDEPQTFNGTDSTLQFIGDGKKLVGAASLTPRYGSTIYPVGLFFKAGQTWVMLGKSLEDVSIFPIANNIGCTARQTIVTIATFSVGQGVVRPVVVWQGAGGIYMSDGTTVTKISDDISDIFRRGSSTEINRDAVDKSFAWHDEENNELHWCYCSGVNTTPDKEWAYDLTEHKWFEVDRTTGKRLLCAFSVKDTLGNSFTYGGVENTTTSKGHLHRLEYGATFDGVAIDHTLRLSDIALKDGKVGEETELYGVSLIAKANTGKSVVATHYVDGEPTGAAIDTIPLDAVRSSRLAAVGRTFSRNGRFHGVEFTLSSSAGNVGLEPLYAVLWYKPVRENIGLQT